MTDTTFATPSPFRLPEAPEPTELVAKYFRGLGDPTRLRMLELLRDEGELSVGELVARLRLPQPTVSTHLACLRWCGFVEARREHRVIYNRIADERVPRLLELTRSLLADNAEHVAACCTIPDKAVP
ncbi:MAG: ArsR/SmtB family transcription factor [Gaiellaceae bacterium]